MAGEDAPEGEDVMPIDDINRGLAEMRLSHWTCVSIGETGKKGAIYRRHVDGLKVRVVRGGGVVQSICPWIEG